MMEHIAMVAEAMMEYAKDAARSETPWELWEAALPGGGWTPLDSHPDWNSGKIFRRRPLRINDEEVPAAMKDEPEPGTKVWRITFHPKFLVEWFAWKGEENDRIWLRRGLVHRQRHEAEAHARAFIRSSGGEV